MRQVEVQAWKVVPKDVAPDEPVFPVGVKDILETTGSDASGSDESERDHQEKNDGTTDKAATPAERIRSVEELSRNMQRLRPQLLLAQGDSDANRNIQESRSNALASLSSLDKKQGQI